MVTRHTNIYTHKALFILNITALHREVDVTIKESICHRLMGAGVLSEAGERAVICKEGQPHVDTLMNRITKRIQQGRFQGLSLGPLRPGPDRIITLFGAGTMEGHRGL